MNDKIKCPNCGHSFDVEEALSGKLEQHYKEKYEKKVSEQVDKFNKEKQKLEDERTKLNIEKEKQAEFLKSEVEKKLKIEKEKIEKSAFENFEEKIKSLEEENQKRKEENKSLKQKEVALLKQEAELKEKEENLKLQLEKQLLEKQKEIEKKAEIKLLEQAEKFNKEKQKFEQEKDKQEELLKSEIEKKLKAEKEKIEKTAFENFEAKIKSLEEENQTRKEENKTLKQKEIALLKQEAELKEKEEDLNFQLEKQLLERQKEIEEKGRIKEHEANLLKEKEYQKQLDEQKKLIEEMKRKAEQGSMQLQGEVQELAIEDLLSRTYPFDIIKEVPKGVRGADSIQIVKNSLQQECGSIVYESKRTKNFASDWIDKLKQDQVKCKADIAVLVTQTLPGEMKRFGEKNGVWICGFHELKSLSLVLREMLIKTHSVKTSEENKGDKMELLYNYLTSNEFVQNIKRIVENYDGMINQLNSEKKAMYKIWSQREKQIWVVQENISSLFGSIKGIAGKELETSNVLQLPDTQIDE